MVIFFLESSPLTASFSYFLHRMRSSFDVIVDISRMASEPLPKLPAMAFETKLRFDWVSSSAYTMVSLSGLEAAEIHTGTIIGQRICCELGFELVLTAPTLASGTSGLLVLLLPCGFLSCLSS